MNPTGLRKNSPLKVFSFSQRDTILTGKAVCLSKKPTAKSTKGQKQISAILEKRKLNLPLGSKSHTEIVSIFFSLDPHSMETINALRKARSSHWATTGTLDSRASPHDSLCDHT